MTGEVEIEGCKQTVGVMFTALFAGWVCGALGIGGGIIYNFLF